MMTAVFIGNQKVRREHGANKKTALGNKMLAVVVLRGRSKSALRFAAPSRTASEAHTEFRHGRFWTPTRKLKRLRRPTLPIRLVACRRCQNTRSRIHWLCRQLSVRRIELKDAKPLETAWSRQATRLREAKAREAELLTKLNSKRGIPWTTPQRKVLEIAKEFDLNEYEDETSAELEAMNGDYDVSPDDEIATRACHCPLR